jgi:hypothetical protein
MRPGAAVAAVEVVEQQVNEDRYSTAISSVGSDQPPERVIGLHLLSRHVEIFVSNADSAEEHRDAYNQYVSTLDLLENYLHNPPQTSTEPKRKPAGLGYGVPNVPYDNKYAAGQLRSMLRLKPHIERLRRSIGMETVRPTIDLANVQLYGQSWAGIDFAWLSGRFFLGIDLRGANLKESIWGASWLERAHLQCADLKDANLQGARLDGADLRGANLEGADFTKAILKDVKLDGATGWEQAKGLPRAPSFCESVSFAT